MKFLRYFIGFIFIIGIGVFIWLIYLYANIRGELDKLVYYKPKLTTQIYDRNYKLIANIFDGEHRIYVKYKDIPPRVIESLVAIEDTSFFEHGGVNIDAILRAIIKDIKHRKLIEGASTITQQLIKTKVLTRKKKIIRKIKEVLLSIKLEHILTKEEILERYLNEVYFGHGYYGIKTASLGYFHKELNELSLKEIAILVGLPRAPSFYDPTKNYKFAIARANQVINRLKTLGWINQVEYFEAIKEKPRVYNDKSLTKNKAPYVVDYVLKLLKKDLPDIKIGGYKIYLTIDLKAQEIAKKALKNGYEKIKIRDSKEEFSKTLNGAIISINSKTGEILALVGGIDYKKSSFNRVTQAKRQLGSAIKPFIYTIALDLGYSPATKLVDISRTYEYKDKDKIKKWQPKNYEKNYKGLISLRNALVHSRNLATINLVTDIGVDIVYKELIRFGFRNLPMDLSITLGSFSISPIKLAELYTIFSNYGKKVKPFIVKSIEKNSKLVFDSESDDILSKEQAFLMTTILKDVVLRGTARSAKVKGIEVAGKTGTTNKYVDAWFCGYTPSIETIVWFGNDDNKPMKKGETGGRSSAPVFREFISNYLKLHPELPRKFIKPKDVKVGYYYNQKEYYTPTSPLPKEVDEDELVY